MIPNKLCKHVFKYFIIVISWIMKKGMSENKIITFNKAANAVGCDHRYMSRCFFPIRLLISF